MQHTKLISSLGFGLGLSTMNCVVTSVADPNHCMHNDGDAFCADRHDGELPYCGYGSCYLEEKDGCVAERPDDDACYSPCGGGKSLAEDEDCEGLADGSSSGEVTTGPTSGPTSQTEPTTETLSTTMTASETEPSSSTASSGCVDSSECADPAAPICFEMACVPCGDAAMADDACAARDPGAPVCGDDGTCVQCTPTNPSACDDTTPVCDGPSSSCVACSFHEQCEATACDIASGACFDDACVIEVDGDGGADYTDIADALSDGCVVVVHERTGDVAYQENIAIDGISVALLAADGESPRITGTGGSPSLSVQGAGTAYVQGVRISLSGGLGIEADGASVYLDRTQVVGNTGGGIVLQGGADGHLRNCFVGGDINDIAAMEVTGATADILYSTLGGGFGSAAALRCNAAATVNVRNALLVARTDDPELDCPTDGFDNSATEAEIGDMNVNWFGGFATGNFALTVNIPDEVLTTALWQAGDPPTDIGTDLRPNAGGTADVAGADIP